MRAEAARFNPDVVHFNVLRSTVDFDRFASIVRIVDLDDIRSDYYRQVLRTTACRPAGEPSRDLSARG